jgi:hypothetical protein
MSPRRCDLLWSDARGSVWGAVFGAQSFAGLRCGVSPWRDRFRACQLWPGWTAGKADGARAVAVAQHGTDGQRRTCRPGDGAAWGRCVEPGCPGCKRAAGAIDGGEKWLRCQRQSCRGGRSEKIVFARSHPSITIVRRCRACTAAITTFGVAFFRPCSKQRGCITSLSETACCTPRTWI